MRAYTYEIISRHTDLGSGWRLRLLEDGQEIGGGVFPMPDAGTDNGMTWWNASSEQERAHWLMVATSAVPADAWRTYQLAQAYDDAAAEGRTWVDTRPQ